MDKNPYFDIQSLSAAVHALAISGNITSASSPLRTIITDSRALLTDPNATVFAALCTPQGDGHRYIRDMYTKGVRVFLVEKDIADYAAYPDATFIAVDNVRQALWDSAKSIRNAFRGPVIGITGSIGKTFTKELLNCCNIWEHCARSPRSWNSSIGVPESLWLAAGADAAIIEAGISHKGEMKILADIIRPTIGIFTAITEEHSEGFDSIESKCREKSLLFASATDIFYNSSYPLIASVLKEMYPKKNLHPCSDIWDICARIANMFGKKISFSSSEIGRYDISGRIDITDMSGNSALALDYYTGDMDGIATALDYVRRRISPEHDLRICVSAPVSEAWGYSSSAKILKAAGVTKAYVIGGSPEYWADVADSGVEIAHFEDTDAFERHITLNTRDMQRTMLYVNISDKEQGRLMRDRLCSLRHITHLNIDLEALVHNVRHYRSLLSNGVGMIAMIKADAYGCGDIEVARTLQSCGLSYLAVAVVDEGVRLRRAGVTMPIIVLDPWCLNPHAIVAYRLEPTLIDLDKDIMSNLEREVAAAGLSDYPIHVKIDSGMHRVGLKNEDEISAFVSMLAQCPHLHIATTFSHLATADCLDMDDYTTLQLDTFDRLSNFLRNSVPYGKDIRRHILNTAGIIRYGRTCYAYDLVRLGIGMYGISPLPGETDQSALKTVATLRTSIIAMHQYPAGATIGYGRRGITLRDSVIATIPIGYADGVNRHLGCRHASFVVEGVPCPTIGNICMDLCMIDVTDCPKAHIGSSVEIFGKNASIQYLAETLDTIPYEVLTSVSSRVKRLYFRE